MYSYFDGFVATSTSPQAAAFSYLLWFIGDYARITDFARDEASARKKLVDRFLEMKNIANYVPLEGDSTQKSKRTLSIGMAQSALAAMPYRGGLSLSGWLYGIKPTEFFLGLQKNISGNRRRFIGKLSDTADNHGWLAPGWVPPSQITRAWPATIEAKSVTGRIPYSLSLRVDQAFIEPSAGASGSGFDPFSSAETRWTGLVGYGAYMDIYGLKLHVPGSKFFNTLLSSNATSWKYKREFIPSQEDEKRNFPFGKPEEIKFASPS
ncbi:hypothetical protein [Streptomyces sp. FIT100]|uniref:hypothetical protein n=1 Tax=Streptomyces sp. FIT100 TaxID=2837956 RepID=UPI0021C7FD78|nr:hypothetical protein [Streptomyces sp. FIT100]UUN30352.1 hypothetical protein KK483_31400 [Streptomyces sp. FIT100]